MEKLRDRVIERNKLQIESGELEVPNEPKARHDNDVKLAVANKAKGVKPKKKLERCFKNVDDERICEPAPIDFTPTEEYLQALETWDDKVAMTNLCRVLFQDYICYDYDV